MPSALRVLIDLVPNHCSWEHPWFRAALAAGRGSAERDLFWFREGADGPDGSAPPNGWAGSFGGSAWERVDDGQWYLHLFDVSQPDWNWEHADGARGVRLDPALLVRPGHRRLPHRRRRLDVQGRHTARSRATLASPVSRRTSTRAIRTGIATRSTTSIGAGDGSPTSTPTGLAVPGRSSPKRG